MIAGGSWDGMLAGPLPGLSVEAFLLLGHLIHHPQEMPLLPDICPLTWTQMAEFTFLWKKFSLRPYLQDGVAHLVLGWSLPPLLFQALGLQEALGGGFLWVYF